MRGRLILGRDFIQSFAGGLLVGGGALLEQALQVLNCTGIAQFSQGPGSFGADPETSILQCGT